MCRGDVDVDVVPACSTAFPAAARHGALPRRDAGFVFVVSRCRCQAFCCRTSRHNTGLTSKFPCVRTQISGVQAFAGMRLVEIPQSGMRGSRAQVLATLARVSALHELSPLMLSPCVIHIRAEGQRFMLHTFLLAILPFACTLPLFPHCPNCTSCMILFRMVLVHRRPRLSVHHCPWVPCPGTTRAPWCPVIGTKSLLSTPPWILAQMTIAV